ncbi:hypothetical protein [Heyndrickxia camelliae]|uniref:hypothetical protein n=1 Tax=Heyndrickxia camelliae TaxID=1707093 RepID=UPI0013FD50EB|nr:hypothetical protein [Heyndrickxia camelliae]
MNKDSLLAVLVTIVVVTFTKDLNIWDSWIITEIVRLILCFIAVFIVAVIVKKVFPKER